MDCIHKKNVPEMKSYRRQLRQYGTSAEGALWRLLKGRNVAGLQFRRQFSVGFHILDFYCPELHLAIELDGHYHYNGVNAEIDFFRDKEIEKTFGIHTLRFENRIVFEHPDSIINAIVEYQQAHSLRSHTPPA